MDITHGEWSEMTCSLLQWYTQNKRDLPWRSDENPYHIWISEIMLQQTRVEAATEYYTRFLKELPDVQALAGVSDERLLKLWEGLGYYSRARNLKRAAIQIVAEHQGQIPASYQELLALPGIGPYTAGAIASIAFELPVHAIDGNVLRVMARVMAIGRDISQKSTVRDITERLSLLQPEQCPGEFNQALMELGALICVPNAPPRCGECPITGQCRAYTEGNPQSYPVKAPKAARKIYVKTVLIVEHDGQYLLHKRPPTGLLAGMWEFPNVPGALAPQSVPEVLLSYGLKAEEITPTISSKHIFTHQEWHMTGFFVRAQAKPPCGEEYRWASPQDIERYISIPSAFRAFVNRIHKQGKKD